MNKFYLTITAKNFLLLLAAAAATPPVFASGNTGLERTETTQQYKVTQGKVIDANGEPILPQRQHRRLD